MRVFPCVEIGETAVIVVAQTPEVVEGYHLQVWPGKSVRQLLADSFKDADARQLLDPLGKCFPLTLGLLLRCRLVASHAVVNFAFLGLAEIEDAASNLAVNENGCSRVRALPLRFGLPVLPFKEHVLGITVSLPCGSL